MGFRPAGVWLIAYKEFICYETRFVPNQASRAQNLWFTGGHGLREVWVSRGSTVSHYTTLPSYTQRSPVMLLLSQCAELRDGNDTKNQEPPLRS